MAGPNLAKIDIAALCVHAMESDRSLDLIPGREAFDESECGVERGVAADITDTQ